MTESEQESGVSTVFVTSHLVLGDVPTTVSGPTTVTTSAEGAVAAILAGATAVLPHGAWETAAQVLRLFGAPEAHISWTLAASGRPRA